MSNPICKHCAWRRDDYDCCAPTCDHMIAKARSASTAEMHRVFSVPEVPTTAERNRQALRARSDFGFGYRKDPLP